MTSGVRHNYGVAPDFACGHQIWIPSWAKIAKGAPGFNFADHGSAASGPPGFYLAILQQDGLALMEAFDTWLHPGVTFADWKAGVLARNGALQLRSNTPARYRTWNGTRSTSSSGGPTSVRTCHSGPEC